MMWRATFDPRALSLTREVVYWPVLALKSISIWRCINCASILLVDLLHVHTIRYIQQFTFYKDNVLFMTYVRFLHGDRVISVTRFESLNGLCIKAALPIYVLASLMPTTLTIT